MQAEQREGRFEAQKVFNYPFTLVSLPKRGFTSSPLPQPANFQVYCPLSCKKIKIGAAKDKNKQTIELNTTASRWVSAYLNSSIRYLVNGHPPIKKDKKKAEGEGWSFYVEVSEKGNYAVFNPYCTVQDQPLSLYTFTPLQSAYPEVSIVERFVQLAPKGDSEIFKVNGGNIYVKSTKDGSFVGVNPFFEDDPNTVITLVHPHNGSLVWKVNADQAIKLVFGGKNYYLNELSKIIEAEEKGVVTVAVKNLDEIYENLRFFLHIEEQIRAKLMNSLGQAKLNEHYPYHPRLYSAWSRFTSFVNYSNTKYDTIKLAELGFYNKTDMLQDLAYFEHPNITIPLAQSPDYQNQQVLRRKLFPFSRAEKKLPNSNVPLSAVTKSILHQKVSSKQLILKQVHGDYLLLVDQDYIVTVWSNKVIPVLLFQFKANQQYTTGNTAIITSEAEIEKNLSNIEKEQAGIESLFDEVPNPAKQVKQVELVPDQAMIDQMVAMGYALSLVKKALIAVKNESVAAAIDMIDQIMTEEKKKKLVIVPRQWSCPTCTYYNKVDSDSCQMCGELCDLVELAEKERVKLEEEVQKQQEKKKEQEKARLQREKQQEKIRIQTAQLQKIRILKQKQEQLKQYKLISVSLIKHNTPIDPFFVLLIFWNEQLNKSVLKVVRIGLNRRYFSRFYSVEENLVVGNCFRVPQPIDFDSFSKIASNSKDTIQWGVKLIEPSKKQEWIISDFKEIDLSQRIFKFGTCNSNEFQIVQQEKSQAFEIKVKDDMKASSFVLQKIDRKVQAVIEKLSAEVKQQSNVDEIICKVGDQITLDKQVTEVSVEILQHLPQGKWQNFPPGQKITIQTRLQSQVTMNEFLPLIIQQYQGSVFSGKHYACSLLEKSSNLYISNYPNANFTFRHDTSRKMFVERVVIASSTKRLQKIYSVSECLIFTANEPTWFHLAKKRFEKFTKEDYENWLSCKKARNSHRQFWEPVGFFQVENETQIELDYKRSAKYVFLLPTTVKNPSVKKDDVYAIKIEFFGVKGRLEEQKSDDQWYNNFKNEGKTDCSSTLLNLNDGKQEELKPQNITVRRISHINSFNILLKDSVIYQKMPTSSTTLFLYRIRDTQHQKVLKITSEFSKNIIVRLKRDHSQEVDYTAISSFIELAKVQNEMPLAQIKKLAERLDTKELLMLILASEQDSSKYEGLINKIYEIPFFKERLFQKMVELIPAIVEDSFDVKQSGFKLFLTLYEKSLLTLPEESFRANTQALKLIDLYVTEHRNKNYNLLRSKYNIEQLALQPYLFSKDYYRQIHPNHVQKQSISLASAEPTGPINNLLWIQQISPYAYRQFIDLQSTRFVENIHFYIPEITSPNFRPKLQVSVYVVNDDGDKLVYSKYFHEDFLVQFGIYGFKDTEIYRGSKLNCFSINNISADARILRVQVSFLLLTSQPHQKYKDTNDKFYIIPLVDSKESGNTVNVSKQLGYLKDFPQQTKHFYMFKRLPPAKYLTQGSKTIIQVFDFPKLQAAQAKKQYKQTINKIVTNIMDESIVREALGNLKISNYELNRKGIDFAYTYAIHLMNFNRKYQTELRISLDLALKLFNTFVIYEIGPIAKKAFSFLQETFKRFTNLQKSTFTNALVSRYLCSIDELPNMKMSDRYSPLKVIEKIQQFQLPVAELITTLDKYTNKPLVLVLIKLITTVTKAYGVGNLQKYNIQTGKYTGKYDLIDFSNVAFRSCLWILDNVVGIKQQALNDGLDLLHLFLTGEFSSFTPEQRAECAKNFISNLQQAKLWKLVFLTLKLKSQSLKERINKLFSVITSNLTDNFKKSINEMVLQIIAKEKDSIYVTINHQLTEQQWMNHLQITLQLISLTKDSVILDEVAALKLLELPLTPSLWSKALNIIPRTDKILLSIIKNFPNQFYNSLGKEIAKFCQPLSGIRSLESIHVNWLDLVRQLRIQGKSLFDLFVLQLQKSSFGGRQGLLCASVQDVKQLQISCELLKLLLDSQISIEHYTEQQINKLIRWYFLNKSKEKGSSPATDKLFTLSQNIKLLFQRMNENDDVAKRTIKCLLEVRRQCEVIQRNFQEKRVPVYSALNLNKRFCQCFEELLGIFMTNDLLCSYFAFELKGLVHILQTMDIGHTRQLINSNALTPDEEFLINEKLIASSRVNKQHPVEIKQISDLKEEQFANNVKLVPNLNSPTVTSTNADWSTHKKGAKTKIIFLPLNEANYYNEYPLYLQLGKTAQVRSIKVGFIAASYEFNDKLVATPSAVIVEGSVDGVTYELIGEMDYIQDDGYIVNGVQVWALNCQKTKGMGNIADAVQTLGSHKIKYLKLIVQRPTVTFLEGQYSQLNGKSYTSLGCNISFLSIIGDDSEKHSLTLLQSCKQISKKSSLRLLSTLLNESNPITMRQISNDQFLQKLFRDNFKRLKQYMSKYPEVMPSVIYLIGSGNRRLGDEIIEFFLSEVGGELEAKIINQIITSTSDKAFSRLQMFLRSILRKVKKISDQNELQSSILYLEQISFLEAFCKTLQQCYQMRITGGTLEVKRENIDHIINIYDKKHASPEIKSLVKLLIHLLHIKAPLSLTDNLIVTVMEIVWNNCTDLRPHFYNLMAGLLIDRKAGKWLRESSLDKIDILLGSIYNSLAHNEYKNLKLQLFLLGQISYHEAPFLREKGVHIELYHKLKNANHQDTDIIETFLKIVRNIGLGIPEEEEKLAKILLEDVGLLVKKRDPFLQKLFVGVLGLESEVMINLSGFDLSTSVKKEQINSKFLTKKHQKILLDKINKKAKYSLLGEIHGYISDRSQDIFVKAFSGPLLQIIRFKILDVNYTVVVYSPEASKKNEGSDYSWEQLVLYKKTGFIGVLTDETEFFVTNQAEDALLANIYNGDEDSDNAAVVYDDQHEIIRFNFKVDGQSTLPQFTFTKYKNQLSSVLTQSTIDGDFPGFSFLGMEFWELRTQSSVNIFDSKLTSLLSKSNQAKAPFSYYRHSPIYLFPANISVQKFVGILGLKGSCTSNGKTLSPGKILSEIENESEDFIIDLQIHTQQDNTEEKISQISEIGYIPVMKIFNHFSSLQGVNEVLRLGTQSLKDWKKADRKKNFQHYMDELRSFINLPNFFNLFIKNQQYVTLLFQVASGLPDDEGSTRNWEEEYTNNFRFIYKIVSDIFKFDRSSALRDLNKYSDFFEIILDKLSQITKQASRVLKQEVKEQEQINVNNISLQKTKSQDRKRKKKGTGYGADNQASSKWSASEWLEARKNISQQTLRVVSIVASFLDCEQTMKDERLAELIKESCLLPLLESALRSSSLLDISKEPELFKEHLHIIRLLSSHTSSIQCLLDIEKTYKPEQSESVLSLLSKLNGIAQIFTECLKSGKEPSNTSNQIAEGISLQIQRSFTIVNKAVKNLKKKKKALTVKQLNSLPVADAYRLLLSNYRFGYVDLKENGVYKHAHSGTISTNAPSTSKVLRLSQELADLSSSLPCEHTNSIFVRCDKSRVDVINVLIMGSKDTPYSNGAFTFDVYCDDSYPNNPPKMLITSTGQGKIRFNPNLYSCGKVCLSLLGTWRGAANENWDPKVSTLLQLFISTQGITMSDDVYFNEPGFEGEQGTEEGDKKNEAYSNIVRLGNVRYAMNGQIKNPPKGFQQVIKRHFYIKRKQILEECDKWVEWANKREASYSGLVNDHNSSWCAQLKQSKTKYRELLVKQVEELRETLNNMQPPDLKEEKQEEQANFQQNKPKEKTKNLTEELKLEDVDVDYEKGHQQVKEYEEHVINDRWSRYIGAMGLEAVKKQAESSVLLVGLKPLGLQIAKNLVLSGLKKLSILQEGSSYEPQQHFFMSNMKSSAIKDCVYKIKELNPYMLVEHVGSLPPLEGYSIVISTEDYERAKQLSEICSQAKTKFIWAQTKGASGVYFADLGLHEVNDDNGEEPFEGMIKHISNEQEGLVTLLDGLKHPYQDGDYVLISKVQGMETKQEIAEEKSEAQLLFESQSNEKINGINNRVFKVKVINWNSFRIGDTRNFADYKGNGLCKNIKIPKKVEFLSLKQCSKDFQGKIDSNMSIYDFEKMGDNQSIFLCYQALATYKAAHKSAPRNWNNQDWEKYKEILISLTQPLEKQQEELDKILSFGKLFSFVSEAELPTIGAYLGGMVAQQAIKAITNKYMPIKQFFTFHFNQLIQKVPEEVEAIEKQHIPEGKQFRNLKIVVGEHGADKIAELKTFVIGAGAIGCELLKNFAMINMGAKGEISVTDPDHIQTSNLSRQFLFREKHVKKAKSATACATLLQMNPRLQGHIIARLDKVCEQTEQIFTNEFFKSRNIVANALDNVKARQYMDKRCVENKIALFESGTLGPKGHVQVIVPYKTQNYGSQNDPNEQAQIPHCTLKMFPEETVHCIEWSRDIFGKLFTLNPKALKKVIQAKSLNALQGQERETVAKMIKYRPQSFDDCIAEAVRKFFIYFRNNIRQLLFTYPLDMKTKQGKLFWSLPKRPPTQISVIDPNDQSHRTFIAAYSVLIAKIYSIPFPKDFRKPQGKQKIVQAALKVKVEDFIPNSEASKEIQKEVEKENSATQQESQNTQSQKPPVVEQKASEQAQITQQLLQSKITPQEFEKDEDSNGHIDLIFSMSNLRCVNYGLEKCTWIDAKLKAGKIMAALSTTTSVVAALQTLEIMKLAVGCEVWRNGFINLAVPLVQISQPGPAVKHKLGNTEFSVWQDWHFKANSLKDLLEQLKAKYEVEGYNISTSSGKPVYWQAMYKQKQEAKEKLLGTSLKQLFGGNSIDLQIALKNPTSGVIYQNVPKVKVEFE